MMTYVQIRDRRITDRDQSPSAFIKYIVIYMISRGWKEGIVRYLFNKIHPLCVYSRRFIAATYDTEVICVKICASYFTQREIDIKTMTPKRTNETKIGAFDSERRESKPKA
jgi:hypothetical protein